MSSENKTETTNKKFNRYIVLDLLGIGGSGKVYRVLDPETETVVALKTFTTSGDDEEITSRLRFRREFRSASRLEHPHLVQVYESGSENDQDYYTMEYIEGSDFEEHLKQFTESLDSTDALNDTRRIKLVLNLFIQITDALAYLHANRFVHRDIKPGNVLVTPDNFVKVADFGLVRDLTSSQLTRTGTIIGTIEYMSPEQTVTAKIDSRSDIYSLGLMMYKAFTGCLPFSGGQMQSLIARGKNEVPDPRSLNPKMNDKICSILKRMLRRRPNERYPDVQILLEELIDLQNKLFGKSQILSTSSMTIEAPLSLVLPPVCTGRENELKQLQSAFDQLRINGNSSLFLIQGEAGIGKTRLIQEIHTWASFHGVLFYSAVCPEKGREDLQDWITLFKGISNDLVRLKTTLSDQVIQAQESMNKTISEIQHIECPNHNTDSMESIRYKFFDIAHRFLSTMSSQTPVILHLDDFHHANKTSVELLQFITRRSIFPSNLGLSKKASSKLLLVVTYRNSELPANHPISRFKRLFSGEDSFHALDLLPLDAIQVSEMILSMLGGEHASPSFNERIFEGTGGNPFFIENTINTLVEEKRLRRRGNVWVGAVSMNRYQDSMNSENLTLPTTIKESVRRRLFRLNDLETQVVQAASVLDKTFSFDQLLFVADNDEDSVLDALDCLIKNGFLVEDLINEEVFHFGSLHFRSVIYENISDDKRSRMHLRAAEYIETNMVENTIDNLANLAYQLSQAECKEKAYPACRQAAKLFFSRSNFDSALYFADRALRFIPTSNQNILNELWLLRANCLIHLRQSSKAKEILQGIIRSTSREPHRNMSGTSASIKLQCEALIGLAHVFKTESKPKKVKRVLETVVNKTQKNNDLYTMTNAKALLGAVFTDLGELDKAYESLSIALNLSKKEKFWNLTAKSYHNIGNLYFLKSNLDQAKQCYESALDCVHKSGDKSLIPPLKNNLANILKQKGLYADAADKYSEAVKAAESLGGYTSWPLYLHNLALVQVYIDAKEDAIKNYRKSLAVFEENGNLDRVAMCLNNLGELLLNSNKHKEAYDLFKQALNIFHTQGYRLSEAAVMTNLGSLSLELELLDQADKYLSESWKIFSDERNIPGNVECQVFRAYLALKRNKIQESEMILDGVQINDQKGGAASGYYHLIAAELELARQKQNIDFNSPEDHLAKCIEIFQTTRKSYYLKKANLVLGHYLISSEKNQKRGQEILDQYSNNSI